MMAIDMNKVTKIERSGEGQLIDKQFVANDLSVHPSVEAVIQRNREIAETEKMVPLSSIEERTIIVKRPK